MGIVSANSGLYSKFFLMMMNSSLIFYFSMKFSLYFLKPHLRVHFLQLRNFVETWSYVGSLSKLFSLTLTKYLNITAGLLLILILMLRLCERTML